MTLLETIISKRGPWCENCGCRPAVEGHHAIIRRSKRHPEYDCQENIEAVCHTCHASGMLDSYSHSCIFWKRQVSRGYDMEKWITSLGLKSREFYV